MYEDIQEVLVSEEELAAKVKELGEQIRKDYEGKDLLLVGVLKGCVIFMSDLMRAIDLPLSIDFLTVSSYGSGTVSGNLKMLSDLRCDVSRYHVLFVEDILDSGKTLYFLKGLMEERGAKSVRICTLLDKPARRVADVKADYVGFNIPDAFVVGYGLDFDEKYRNVRFIGALKPEKYAHIAE